MNPSNTQQAARWVTDGLNPFIVFTLLFAAGAFTRVDPASGLRYLVVQLSAAGFVAGYVWLLRRNSRVSGVWMPGRAERIIPAAVLLLAFVGLLLALYALNAPQALLDTTLSMGLAAAAVAALTLVWKASAHCTVAGHAAIAGPLLLGPAGLIFSIMLPLVLWSRVTLKDHTLLQTIAGASIGAAFATLSLA